jgi:uncharacterized membrane protein
MKEETMSKYIVCVFDDSRKAYEGARALEALDLEGSIALYEGAILSKSEDGVVRVEDAEEEGPIGALGGMLLGSLIGVIAGPVGMAVGAVAGSAAGLMGDAARAGVNDEFLEDVAGELTPGKYALVAEISEGWTTPLDTRMEALGGVVFRAWRIDVEDEQIERDIQATHRDVQELKEEWHQAVGDAKEKMKTKIQAAEAKLQSLDDRLEKKVEAMMEEQDAKVEKLNQQIAKAEGDLKKKLQKNLDELKADYERRKDKLKQAGRIAAEALK